MPTPAVQLKSDVAMALHNADQLVVQSGGGGFDVRIADLEGENKEHFLKSLLPLLQIECRALLSIGNRTTSRPGLVIHPLQNGRCSKLVVIHTSRHTYSVNEFKRLRDAADRGTSLAALPTCPQEENVLYWFGMPYDYEYVLRP